MDFNDFSKEEIAGHDEIFEQLAEQLAQYKLRDASSSDEADSLQQSFDDLKNLYDKGKKVWFDQHRLIFQEKIMKPEFNGIRNFIAVDFNRFYTRLTLPEKLMVSNYSENKYSFLIHSKKESEALLMIIEKCVALFSKAEYSDKGITEYLLNDRKNIMLLSLPNMVEEPIFRFAIEGITLRFEVVYTGDKISNFEALRYNTLSCIIKATEREA